MSELKAIESATAVIGNVHLVYSKSEADKVIAEKDKEIAKLKSKLDLYKRGFAEDNKINAYLYAELRRQKHKRCLTNAWWCLREEFFAEDCHCERWVDWAIKWYKRWLEIAEKFKPNN